MKRSSLARLDSDGLLDQSFVADLSLFGSDDNPCGVYKIAVQLDGKLLVGLQSFGNRGADDYLIRLNHDGSIDTDFEPVNCDFPDGDNQSISSLAIQPDGKILVGGSFQTVNGVPSPYMARLKGGGASGVRSLRLESMARTSDGRTELSLTVPPAMKFVLQASSDLSNWMPLSTNIVPGSEFNFNDRDAPRFSKRFYRVVEEP